jgi:hypothetical protein
MKPVETPLPADLCDSHDDAQIPEIVCSSMVEGLTYTDLGSTLLVSTPLRRLLSATEQPRKAPGLY